MTRINVVPVTELCDQHLLAEHRELTRIPNGIASGRYDPNCAKPADYVLGAGHVKFFMDKLAFLRLRYSALHAECQWRGFNVTWKWPEDHELVQAQADGAFLGYAPTPEALALNRARIAERMPAKPRWTRR